MKLIETPFGKVLESDYDRWSLVKHYMSPLLPYYGKDGITEIMVNKFDHIEVEGPEGMYKVDATFDSEDHLKTLIEQIANALNQVVNSDEPILHARFPDQSRACCTLQDVSPDGCSMTLRIAPKKSLTWDDLIKYKAITPEMVAYIDRAVTRGANGVLSGSTGSGKTTVLRGTASFIGPEERVITAEDTRELYLNLRNQLNLEAPKRKGSKITLATLIETTLRQRPDRIIVGEIRDGMAAGAFLQAVNTGHSGCWTSLHANSPNDALSRIQFLIASQGLISYDLAGKQLLGSINVLIQADRIHGVGRRITAIAEVIDGKVEMLFSFDRETNKHVIHEDVLSRSQYC